MDFLDESDLMMMDLEFNGYLHMARDLMKKMRLAEDRRVSEKYIRSCLLMSKSDQSKVKFHRNRFFRFLLKTMRRTVDSQGLAFVHFPDGVEMEDGQEMTQWSADKRSYVAAKIIPGFGSLVYMACTDDVDMGWEENGFSNFIGVNNVPNLAMFNQPKPDPVPTGFPNQPAANVSPTVQAFISNVNPVPVSRSSFPIPTPNPTVTFGPPPQTARTSLPSGGAPNQASRASGSIPPFTNRTPNPSVPNPAPAANPGAVPTSSNPVTIQPSQPSTALNPAPNPGATSVPANPPATPQPQVSLPSNQPGASPSQVP